MLFLYNIITCSNKILSFTFTYNSKGPTTEISFKDKTLTRVHEAILNTYISQSIIGISENIFYSSIKEGNYSLCKSTLEIDDLVIDDFTYLLSQTERTGQIALGYHTKEESFSLIHYLYNNNMINKR